MPTIIIWILIHKKRIIWKKFLENKVTDLKDGVINKLSVVMARVRKIALECSLFLMSKIIWKMPSVKSLLLYEKFLSKSIDPMKHLHLDLLGLTCLLDTLALVFLKILLSSYAPRDLISFISLWTKFPNFVQKLQCFFFKPKQIWLKMSIQGLFIHILVR